MPALLNITSRRPNVDTAVSTARATWSSLVTSVCTNVATEPNAAARAWPGSSWMSAITTRAPSSTKRRTVPSPIPLDPPVMTATLPSSRPLAM